MSTCLVNNLMSSKSCYIRDSIVMFLPRLTVLSSGSNVNRRRILLKYLGGSASSYLLDFIAKIALDLTLASFRCEIFSLILSQPTIFRECVKDMNYGKVPLSWARSSVSLFLSSRLNFGTVTENKNSTTYYSHCLEAVSRCRILPWSPKGHVACVCVRRLVACACGAS